MRNLCFGGSFNPIHYGHLVCGEAVARAIDATRLVLIPSAKSPHKLGHTDMASAEDRLAMCRLAVVNRPLFEVDDLEIRRGGASYTIDTIRALRRERGWEQIHWLIGADQVPALPLWREPAALLQEATVVVMSRPGWTFDWQGLPSELRVLQNHVVEVPAVPISATDIRRRVRSGLSIDELTTPGVANYIHSHGLYRD